MTLCQSRFCTSPFGVILLLVLLQLGTPANALENLAFKGTLVNAPCTLREGDEELELAFGNLIDRYLYSNNRTPSRPLSLHLDDCDTAVMTGVKLTFIGTENAALPGLLALDPSSVARGVAIGMESGAGQPWPINVSRVIALTPGNMVIPLQAFVQVEPAAQSGLGIVRGTFTATATFVLQYQ